MDYVRDAIDRIGVEKKYAERIELAERILEFTFPVKRDDGSTVFLTGYRSQHNSALGPYKSGIRYHPGVNRDEVLLLSKLMTIKNSLAGLPYGGGKGGVCFNPKEFSKSEVERISRAYVQNIYRFIGPDLDIPAPDVNTDGETMAWMSDEYNKLTGKIQPATFTGKPIEFGGLNGREEATGRGAYYVMASVFSVHKIQKSASIAIQGFGNVGMNLARILHENGYKIVAVSDSKGGVYNAKGLDIKKLIEMKTSGNSVADYETGETITNEGLLEIECDVLVPAALDNQIRKDNADKINAKYVFEAANNPTTPDGDAILNERKINVFPDVLVNAGGVSGSYLEWVQNREGEVFEYSAVVEKLRVVMERAFRKVLEEKQKSPKLSYREAAYNVSVRRLVSAMKYIF
ncbi:MAG: Glu/Leu/Phe/Val family dehydrogenase [Candidatus Micrarchaeia archaeon]